MSGRWIVLICVVAAAVSAGAIAVALTDDTGSTTIGSGGIHAIDGARVRSGAAAVDADGTTVAVWSRTNPGGTWSVVSADRPAGEDWGPSRELVPARPWQAGRIRVAIGAGGDTAVVYMLMNRSRAIVQAAYRPAGGRWEAPQTLSRVAHNIWDAQVAVDADGGVTVAWVDGGSAGATLHVAQRQVGRGWRDPVRIVAADARRPWSSGVWLAPAPGGGAHVLSLWQTARTPQPILASAEMVRVGPRGGVSDVPAPPIDRFDPSTLAMAATTAGPALAWAEPRGETGRVLRASVLGAGGWSEAAAIDRTDHPTGPMAVAPDGPGAAVLWTTWVRPRVRVAVRGAVIGADGEATPATTVDEYEVADPRRTPGSGVPLDFPLGPPPGEITAGMSGPPSALWARGGYPSAALQVELGTARLSDGRWIPDPILRPGGFVAPLAVAGTSAGFVTAWVSRVRDDGSGRGTIAGATRTP